MSTIFNTDQMPLTLMGIAALDLVEKGMSIFPLKENSKIPATIHGFKDASSEVEKIKRWWKEMPNANIGIATGRASNLWVLDIDGAEGEESLKSLEESKGAIPISFEVISGGGGRHIYFAMPPSGKIACSASKIGQHLDVRGDGGYIVAPPSMHPSGRRYEISVDSSQEIGLAPSWLADLVMQSVSREAINNERIQVDHIKRIGVGKRNNTLTQLCGHLLRCNVEPFIVLELCQSWNQIHCDPPLKIDEVEKTVDSIAGRELRRRLAK